jgi:hypothetical protein
MHSLSSPKCWRQLADPTPSKSTRQFRIRRNDEKSCVNGLGSTQERMGFLPEFRNVTPTLLKRIMRGAHAGIPEPKSGKNSRCAAMQHFLANLPRRRQISQPNQYATIGLALKQYHTKLLARC